MALVFLMVPYISAHRSVRAKCWLSRTLNFGLLHGLRFQKVAWAGFYSFFTFNGSPRLPRRSFNGVIKRQDSRSTCICQPYRKSLLHNKINVWVERTRRSQKLQNWQRPLTEGLHQRLHLVMVYIARLHGVWNKPPGSSRVLQGAGIYYWISCILMRYTPLQRPYSVLSIHLFKDTAIP